MTEFIRKIAQNPKDDVLAGMTVSLAMIPEVVAFAFVAQIDPLVALSGAFMIGLITAVFGGRPGLISGAAGAVAVIFVHLIAEGHAKGMLFDAPIDNMGYFYLLAAVVLSFQDLDGDGEDAPVINSGDLAAGVTYNGSIELLNETESPAEDITEEVEEEDLDHQFFYTVGSGLDKLMI